MNCTASAIDPHDEMAMLILSEVLRFRRSVRPQANCAANCPLCQAPHIPKVLQAVRAQQPVSFVLPAFPGKSPNPAKVLGPLPDKAEQLALQFLQRLCDRIRRHYEPGAEIVICSDGRVFSDVVGIRESDITNYQMELDQMIEQLGLKDLSTFHLSDVYKNMDFMSMRTELMTTYGQSLEELRQKVHRGSQAIGTHEDEEAHRMYCGITRFLVEDASFPGQSKSRSAIQRESKVKALEVIRRSNAWSELLADRFHEAVRLSIHPQTCGAKKLGIRLIGNESWITPWHGVAVEREGTFVLMKRAEAEKTQAKMVYSPNGRPSHFEEASL